MVREFNPEKMTKAQRVQWGYGVDAMRMIEHDLHAQVMTWKSIPPEWHEIWKPDPETRGLTRRCTMRLDADVVRFFKSFGTGYQARMNRVLRAYMHLRLAGIIDGPDTTDYVLNPGRMLADGARPVWGETVKDLAKAEKSSKRALSPGKKG